MSMKRTFAILGSLLILGAGDVIAAQQNPAQKKNQAQERNKAGNTLKGETKSPLQNRLMFRDENGDGICDSSRDHENDGVPNGQDPDWSRGKDGKGNQSRFGNNNLNSKYGIRNGQGGGNNWSNQSFRQSRSGGSKGVCGRAGSQGHLRKGGKQ